MREQAEKMRQAIQPEVREQLEKSRQKLQHEMERVRHQLQGDWLDI
jgi:F0F1-type ATP synthase membrane subunit b/b'